MKHLRTIAMLTAMSVAPTIWAQDAYVVGLSGVLTGPNADTYAPSIQAVTVYMEQLNKRGGINGKPVRLIVQDNQGNPSKAAADAKKFATQDNAILIVNIGLSSSFGPMVAEATRARIPLLFGGGACPLEVLPPNPHELQFCSASTEINSAGEMAMQFITELSREPVKLGIVAMAIPISRGAMDYADKVAPKYGVSVVRKETIPPATADYTASATALKSAEPNWVYSLAPWVTEVKSFEALRKLGWTGKFLGAALNPTEGELARVKDEGLYVLGPDAFFVENTPAHQEIREAVRNANITYPVTDLVEGWVAAMVIEQSLKGAAWPPTAEKVLASMSNLKVDTRGLRGGPIEWSKTNHIRSKQYYRIYHWNDKKRAVVRVKDWTAFDVK